MTDEATASREAEARGRLLTIALEIINERGDFELPMRALAARAQVSLRKPYEIFGSKNGVISAILKSNQIKWREQLSGIHPQDELHRIFDEIRVGIDHFALNQPFYRALFRATQGYSGGDETEPMRENLRGQIRSTQRAIAAGLLRPDLNPVMFGELLTSIWAANMRNWAASEGDIELTASLIEFAFIAALAGVALEPAASQLHARLLTAQATYQRLLDQHSTDTDTQQNETFSKARTN